MTYAIIQYNRVGFFKTLFLVMFILIIGIYDCGSIGKSNSQVNDLHTTDGMATRLKNNAIMK